jgi:hypothetical protein
VQVGRQKILAFAFASILVFPVFAIGLTSQKAFADGLTQEMFSASLGDRQAELLVRVNPPILTDASRDEAYMLLRLYDANNNETIKFTTFGITVEKGVGENAERIFSDVFHTESGLLQLRVQPAEGPVQFFGTRDQFLNALIADPGGRIIIRGPMFLEGGIYHIRIDILGIDSIRQLFPPDQIRRFDSWLSVGDVFTQSIEYQGKSYDTEIISYYDQVEDFNFDAETQQLSWSMPFDWNVERIRSTNIFVHEEVKVPKSLPGIGDSFSLAATVNGKPISGKQLAIDPYSSEQELTLHYLINKNDILSMAEQIPAGTSEMTFTLAPATGENAQTTTEFFTETGNIKVVAEWTPSQLSADTESTLTLSFFDEFAGAKISDDVNYNLRILDSNGTEVYSESELVAEGGTATQTINFPSNENYRIEVQITGIAKEGEPVDQTRNGIARGTVVVPEFPAGALVAIAGVIGAVIVAQRFARKMPSLQ